MDNTDKLLDDLFEKARTVEPKTSFKTVEKQFLTNTKLGSKTKFLTLKNGIIMTLSISTMAVVTALLINNTSNTKTEEVLVVNDRIIEEKPNAKQLITGKEEHQLAISTHIKKVKQLPANLKSIYNINKSLAQKVKPITIDSLKRAKQAMVVADRNKEVIDTSFSFPRLTAEEIEANNKQKIKMFGKQKRKTTKLLKAPNWFVFIPSGKYTRKEEQKSVNAFFMRQTEVTNLEYRTFLFDLLIQNRKEEFLIAKPDQSRWVKDYPYAFNKPMEENYFSHPAYDEYPVVGISREGVAIFCKWYSEELTKTYHYPIAVRLPTKYEWEYAATGGQDKSPYPWGGPYLRNSKGCFLANFKPERPEELMGENQKYKDIKYCFNCDGGFHTVKTTSYNPNDFGLYCMAGNVAEMIVDENGKPATKGGSWTSIGHELQIIDGKDRFKGLTKPSVDVGFRPVITYVNAKKPLKRKFEKQELITPPGTVQISTNLYFDETEITNFSWLEYITWMKKEHGKNSNEYKNSLPDSLVWRDVMHYNEPYVKYYFTHAAYRDYPVVGISYEQAVAYCKWRTDRVKQISGLVNAKDIKYRLPTKEEWEAVAKAGYSSIPTKSTNMHHFNLKRSKKEAMGVAGKLNDNADVTAPVQAYWPNNYGVYNIIGNVAEMVQEKGVAKGGSWRHTAEGSALTKDINYTKPTSWLGFRCVCEIVY